MDIVHAERMNRFTDDHGSRLDDLFTADERTQWGPDSLACAWAIKEATLKAIGGMTGWETDWTEIETVSSGRIAGARSGATSGQDQPRVLLHGKVAQIAKRAGVAGVHATLTRTKDYVLAMTVATS